MLSSNVVGVFIDPISGALATETTQKKKLMYYIKGTQPSLNNPVIDETTNQ